MKPLKSVDNKSLIESNLVDEIFFTIPEILDHHERFLNALQERLADDWDSSQVIGNVFIEAVSDWFCNRHHLNQVVPQPLTTASAYTKSSISFTVYESADHQHLH